MICEFMRAVWIIFIEFGISCSTVGFAPNGGLCKKVKERRNRLLSPGFIFAHATIGGRTGSSLRRFKNSGEQLPSPEKIDEKFFAEQFVANRRRLPDPYIIIRHILGVVGWGRRQKRSHFPVFLVPWQGFSLVTVNCCVRVFHNRHAFGRIFPARNHLSFEILRGRGLEPLTSSV